MSVPEPKLTILGVYRPQISAKTWRKQQDVTGDEEYTREHFARLVLIEAVAENLPGRFEMIKFGQRERGYLDDPRRMQVGYDEGLLSADGETLIERNMHCVHGSGTLRFAVYLHLYDPERPLQWEFGQVTCPPVEDAPVRLMMLMPYNACC